MRDALFRLVARGFPTERIGESRALAALWHMLFSALAPTQPFVMRTRRYPAWIHPRKNAGTLTRYLIRRGVWEQDATDAFLAFARPGAFVIDVGANFGHYALSATGAVGREGLVIAFEPDRASFAMLEANAALRPELRLRCVNAGLGARRETLALAHDDSNPGGHSFVPGNVDTQGAINAAEVHSLDAWLDDGGLSGRRLTLMKIDVQGFEGQVIAGAARTIARDRPAVLCEVTPAAMAKAGDSYRALIDFFAARNYALRPILDGAPREMGAPALIAILEDGREYADVLFVPR